MVPRDQSFFSRHESRIRHAVRLEPQGATEPGPGPRNGHGLAYDLRDGALVLFGGATSSEVRGDTWVWMVGRWHRSAASGPSRRTFPVLVYDAARNELILFGGNRVLFGDSVHPPEMLGDTWIRRADTWMQVATQGPSPRAEAAAAYDPARGRTVLFGGYERMGNENRRLGDTWEWDGTGWMQVSRTGPSPRNGAAMAYDPGSRRVVLFGGSGGPLGDTWSWDGREWVRLPLPAAPGRFNTAMAWDPATKRLVRFGGWDGSRRTSDTWELRPEGWTLVQGPGPGGRNHTVLVSAPERGSVLLYGGHDGELVFGDMWERRNGRWTPLQTAEPIPRVPNGH